MAKSNTAPKTEESNVPQGEVKTNPIVRDGYDLDELRKTHQTKSSMIRFLAAQKDSVTKKPYTRGSIASFMDIRYQHVRNVLVQKPKGQQTEAAPAPASDKK